MEQEVEILQSFLILDTEDLGPIQYKDDILPV